MLGISFGLGVSKKNQYDTKGIMKWEHFKIFDLRNGVSNRRQRQRESFGGWWKESHSD